MFDATPILPPSPVTDHATVKYSEANGRVAELADAADSKSAGAYAP